MARYQSEVKNLAFEFYGIWARESGRTNAAGDPEPSFDCMTEEEQEAWYAATAHVFRRVAKMYRPLH